MSRDDFPFLGRNLALLALACLVLAGQGERWGWLSAQAGGLVLRWGACLAAGGFAASALGWAFAYLEGNHRERLTAILGIFLGLLALFLLARDWRSAAKDKTAAVSVAGQGLDSSAGKRYP